MSKIQVGRGAIFLYIENVSTMLYGYAFWYILSKITSPDVIGISSSLISLATIFVSLASMGIPLGSQRFLAKFFVERRFNDARVLVNTSLFIVAGGIIICSAIILTTSGWSLGNYDLYLVYVTVVLVAASTISTQFRYVIIASLETKRLVVISIASSTVKILLTVFLVLGGTNELGVMIGFTITPILSSIFLGLNAFSIVKGHQDNSTYKFIKGLKPLLRASIVSWIPLVIDNIGAQMGTITVLAIQGSAEAGIYFIAFQITVGISAVIWALESVAYPALSTMKEGRPMFLWKVIKIGLIIVLPVSTSIIFYSQDVMRIFGYSYVGGTYPLQILLLSILPTAITAGISILAYSYGNYRQVLLIGLAVTVPRAILYFMLIPLFGGTGAALSYTIGSIAGLVVSLLIARRMSVFLSWKHLGLMFIIPISLSFIVSNFKMHFIIAILVSVISSYLLLLKIRIVDRNDVEGSISLFPRSMAVRTLFIINKIASKLNKNY